MAVDVHVVTPQREVWAGAAQMVIARGVAGEVGILGGHAPLLIRLAVGPLRIQEEGGQELRAVVDMAALGLPVRAPPIKDLGIVDRRRLAIVQDRVQ